MSVLSYLSYYVPYLRPNNGVVKEEDQPGLHLLYDGTEENTDQSVAKVVGDKSSCLESVDIIAVHGLGGNAFDTWRHPETNTMWLQDLLPTAVPFSRIMSYGYNAKIDKSRNTLDIMHKAEDLLCQIQGSRNIPLLSERRIILIGHSMGGLLINKALTMAQNEKRYQDILRSTNGIMFMGTPHDGSDAAKLASTLARIAGTFRKIDTKQLKMLETGSENLQGISRDFGFLSNLRIVTVYESNETYIPYLKTYRLIVPKHSARLNLGDREKVFPIADADHHMVCKFRGERDKQYHKVRSAIQELANPSKVNMSTDIDHHQRRLQSIDESIDQGSRKIQKTMHEGFSQTNNSVIALEISSERRHMMQILWSLPHCSSKNPERTPQTGLKFLQTKQYNDWKKGLASFLWLHGKSGTGKTFLSSAVSEDVSHDCALGPLNSAAASVYCSYTDSDIASVLSTIVSGLVDRMPEIPEQTMNCIGRCQSNRDNESDLTEALRYILLYLNQAYLVIDGLDEWPTHDQRRNGLLDWIETLKGWHIPHLHVLLTSQHTPDIHEKLRNIDAYRLDPRSDILIYIRHQLHADPKLAEYDHNLKKKIEKSLLAGNDQVFRWVALQVMELRSCRTSRDIHKALQALPKTLVETYDRILDSVSEKDQTYVRAALQWIACSVRPLTPNELASAAIMDPEAENPYDPGIQFPEGGKKICQMLSRLIEVEVVEHLAFWGRLEEHNSGLEKQCKSHEDVFARLVRGMRNAEIPGDSVVKFSHSSVRTYLLQQPAYSKSPNAFLFSMDIANRFVSKSCSAFMRQLSAAAASTEDIHLADPLTWSIYSYGYRHWYQHAASLPAEDSGSLIRLFNENSTSVDTLMRGNDEYAGMSLGDILDWDFGLERLPEPEMQLRFAACCGCSRIITDILQLYPDIDIDFGFQTGNLAANALMLACERDHWQIVDILLERGADPNSHNEFSVPLLIAVEQGNDHIVRELLAHGADANVLGGHDNLTAPLLLAIEAGHSSITLWLLHHGALPNPITDDMPSPLSFAAWSEDFECIDLLLKHGASLECSKLERPSILELVSKSGCLKMVQLLLDREVDPNSARLQERLELDYSTSGDTYRLEYPKISFSFYRCIQDFGSPIHVAAAFGYTDIIKLLVKNGAAVDEKSYYWETPATLAKLGGHESALEFLSVCGAAVVDLPDVSYRQDRFRRLSESDEYRVELYGIDDRTHEYRTI